LTIQIQFQTQIILKAYLAKENQLLSDTEDYQELKYPRHFFGRFTYNQKPKNTNAFCLLTLILL